MASNSWDNIAAMAAPGNQVDTGIAAQFNDIVSDCALSGGRNLRDVVSYKN
ncbi:polymorphic toxin type 34 domain-containing protein [Hafnia sp. HMSC23F03]|uniref:polymorphic toxin type 34 domain-containing protein n=1 Tax=Hafnia sp. HMSC23F03 TaxID=1581059 RepID=UPI00143A6FA4|nr:polymorphic toxin type 34 domain-containing protein [Hafnia sp. HMSC23F03]